MVSPIGRAVRAAFFIGFCMNVIAPIDNTAITKMRSSDSTPIVVAGGGPVGTRVAQALSQRGEHVVLFNAERWKPYNRVKLTPLLAGEAQIGEIFASEHFPLPGSVSRYDGVSVVDVDRDNKLAHLSTGRVQPYAKLILALGSRAFVPAIPGAELSHVYTFRNFNDAEALVARSMSARNVVIIGGGLLGLEAARGMASRGANVTVIEHENRLMPRQLDVDAGENLKLRIEELGITIITGERVKAIEGNTRVERVLLGSGADVKADTVIICTGVRANIQLPSGIGLDFNQGVLVDDHMRTSDLNIYAVGECAEHNNHVYGLVGPGYDQANIAVAHITGQDEHTYLGSVPATKLKVVGADVFSMGDFESAEQQSGVASHTFRDPAKKIYRRIFTDRGKLIAALGVGEWPEATKLQQAVGKRQSVHFWNTRQFKSKGSLWGDAEDKVSDWPLEAIVCNCTATTKGAIVDSVAAGATTLEEVRSATSANTVCGSCQPLVLELMGDGTAKPVAVSGWQYLLIFSCVAVLAALATALLPPIPLPTTFIKDEFWTELWFNTIHKQYTGYTLLVLTVLAALIGLRKRIKVLSRIGTYDSWRVVHLVIGFVAAAVLIAHTGFRLGDNINFLLMVSFLLTLGFGAIAGFITGGEHELQERGITKSTSKPRSLPLWVHILALWPLPVLLAAHIVIVYAY